MMIVDDEEKKDDGMLEHKGMAWQRGMLTYLTDKRSRRRRWLSINLTLSSKDQRFINFISLTCFKKRPRVHFFFFFFFAYHDCNRVILHVSL